MLHRRRDLPRARRVGSCSRARAEFLTSEALRPRAHRDRRDVVGAQHGGRGRRTTGRREVARVPSPPTARSRAPPARAGAASGRAGRLDTLVEPDAGTVLEVKVADGDAVEVGQVLCIVEAMKMENEVTAHRAGTVTEIAVVAWWPVNHRPADLRDRRGPVKSPSRLRVESQGFPVAGIPIKGSSWLNRLSNGRSRRCGIRCCIRSFAALLGLGLRLDGQRRLGRCRRADRRVTGTRLHDRASPREWPRATSPSRLDNRGA